MKIVPWVCFEIENCGNAWEAYIRNTEYEFENYLPVTRSEVHNIDRETYEFTVARSFFDAVRSGKIVCTKDTQIRIVLKCIDLQLGSHRPDVVEKYKSKWGTIDYFDVSKDKFPHGPVLIRELISQIKSCRHLMQGELKEYDYKMIEREDQFRNEHGWLYTRYEQGKL